MIVTMTITVILIMIIENWDDAGYESHDEGDA